MEGEGTKVGVSIQGHALFLFIGAQALFFELPMVAGLFFLIALLELWARNRDLKEKNRITQQALKELEEAKKMLVDIAKNSNKTN